MRMLVTVPWAERLGGAEAMLQSALDGSRESGHEVELVFFEPGSWAQELTAAGYRVTVLRAGRLRQVHRTLATVLRLARILHKRKPDLLLNWSAKTQLYGAPAASLAGIGDRVVWWQQAIPSSKGWLDRSATLLPSRAVACYSRAAADAQEQLFPHRPTVVIAAGAPLPREGSPQAPPLQLPSGVPIVGLVGRLQPWKGQDRMLRAQAILRDRGAAMHLVLVGGDSWGLSPEYAESLSGLIEQLGLAEAVTMTGEVPDADPYVRQMDVLVNASDPEPFGIVLLEGMARGVAVLAVRSGGPAEFIEHERTGLLARSGGPEDLADALEPLLRSADLRARIAAAGRERFLSEYTDAALGRRFFAAFERVIAPDSRGDVG
ncbi:MAG TPA: glycosyltransferase [Solirubrobacteraceae bacterium]|jgi:glycosyltransferase involved in cell wall biosynthesis|nr:glycosyltransferase [Solirubrobacteraceae bacterium]